MQRVWNEPMWWAIALAFIVLTLPACGGSGDGDDASGNGSGAVSTTTYTVCTGPDSQNELLLALFKAHEGDIIELCPGEFHFDQEIPVNDKRGITLRGAGRDSTFVSFAGSRDSWGFAASRMKGFTLQGLTVEDPNTKGIVVSDSDQVTLRDIRVRWSGGQNCSSSLLSTSSCSDNGEYGIAVEFSRDVVVDNVEVFGATMIGLHLAHVDRAMVNGIHAEHNVVGVILNNIRNVTVSNSLMIGNSLGLMVQDFRYRPYYSGKNALVDSRIEANNTPNFTRDNNILAALPSGIGVLHSGVDQFEYSRNEFINNGTAGMAIINEGLLGPDPITNRFDFFPEGLNIHDNLFRDNGGQPAIPDPRAGAVAAFVPLVLVKNGGKAAHIAWDGAVDAPNDCDTPPTDERGVPLTQKNPDSDRPAPRTDERGQPIYEENDPEPPCHWTAWKFDEQGNLKPENRLYIDNNRFENTQLQTLLIDDFSNFHITSAEPDQLAQDMLVPASNDLSPHAGVLASFPRVEPTAYVLDPRSNADRVSATQTAQACAGGGGGQVNWSALLRHYCPRLSDYSLFADPADPRHSPNPRGMPYSINTKLFSDYAVKYRFVFVPPGKRIAYADFAGDPEVSYDDNSQRAMDLPVGSVIAKTFAFRVDDQAGNTVDEDIAETRLLIKRQEYDREVWVGMAYRWRDTAAGPVAELLPEGATRAASFDYLDADPEVLDANGERQRYTGATDHYAIPSAASCAACHGGSTRDPGTSPISFKPRHMNLEAYCEATGSQLNQLDCLVATGLLEALPDQPENLERTPRWNVPGDTGEPAGSPQDVHQRMRAYLDINCSYCHSQDGRAHISGMFLDSFRPFGLESGVCQLTQFGGRFGARTFNIVPGDAANSVLHHRDTINDALRMPQLARSIVNEQASDLMVDWINRALVSPEVEVGNTEGCNAGSIIDIPVLGISVP